MTAGGVTEEQLAKSNEPQFQTALQAKQGAQEQAQTAPGAYRKAEQGLLAGAKSDATGSAGPQLKAMHGDRDQAFGAIGSHQLATKAKDEQERAQVAQHVQELCAGTKQKVEDRLAKLDEQSNQIFDQGAEQARQDFEDYVAQRFSDWKYDRYLNRIGGSLLWVKD